MSTGYTACIKDGISFEKFVMQCARAMGACIMMRDEPSNKPILDEFEPSSYHFDRLKEIKKELEGLKKLTQIELSQKAEEVYKIELEQKERGINDNIELRKKYNDMLAKVTCWKPPTKDHQEFRDFMIKQIEGSIEFDCSNEYYRQQTIRLLSAQEYFEEKHSHLLNDITYNSEEWEKEKSRIATRNNWIKELRKSLKNTK